MTKVIINLEELQKRQADENLVIIDLRDEEIYNQGHFAGAINMVANKYFIGKETYLPNLDQLGEALGEKGISNASEIILYDGGSFRQAARAYFVFNYLNHHKLSILDDEKIDYKLTTDIPVRKKAEYSIQPIESRAVGINYIEEKLMDDSSMLIDSRSAERYLGVKEPKYKQAGHIPNARNYESKSVFTENGSWRSPEELKEHYKHLNEKDEVIVSCGSGGSACLNFVGLKVAGFENVKMYSGGFSEWIDNGKEIKSGKTKA